MVRTQSDESWLALCFFPPSVKKGRSHDGLKSPSSCTWDLLSEALEAALPRQQLRAVGLPGCGATTSFLQHLPQALGAAELGLRHAGGRARGPRHLSARNCWGSWQLRGAGPVVDVLGAHGWWLGAGARGAEGCSGGDGKIPTLASGEECLKCMVGGETGVVGNVLYVIIYHTTQFKFLEGYFWLWYGDNAVLVVYRVIVALPFPLSLTYSYIS